MTDKLWYKFKEYNDHEGETWNFFVQLSSEEFWHIKTLIDTDGEFYLEDSYSLGEKTYDEATINTIVEEVADDGGYMPSHMKCPPPYRGDILKLTAEEASDEWYKGRFWH